MPETSTLQIPQDVLQPIINAHVSAAIATALGSQSRLIEEAVRASLEAKVDERGQPSSWSNAQTFLKWLVNDSIRQAAVAAVREHLTKDVENIKAAVAKELKNQRSTLTRSLIEGIAKSAMDSGRFQIQVTVDGAKQ